MSHFLMFDGQKGYFIFISQSRDYHKSTKTEIESFGEVPLTSFGFSRDAHV